IWDVLKIPTAKLRHRTNQSRQSKSNAKAMFCRNFVLTGVEFLMNSFSKSTAVKFLGTAVAALTLAACGGGGGGGGGAFFPIPPGGGTGTGTVIAASGTAARGAMLIGAAVNLKCANNA